MRKTVKFLTIGFFAMLLIIFTSCGSGGLDGTWLLQNEDVLDVATTISFNRGGFTITTGGRTSISRTLPNGEFGNVSDGRRGWRGRSISSSQFVREYTTTQLASTGIGVFTEFEHIYRIYRVLTTGTYSIADDHIEFVFSDGHIDVFSFRRTENTITIGAIGTFHRR